jgi:medium-chain acyl-[acyl-carrier-protein] hydrolase
MPALRVSLSEEERRQFWAFQPTQDAQSRLFCFPYGGGGASAYSRWARKIVSRIQLCPIQPPGRENRHAEVPITQFDRLIGVLVDALGPLLDLPFALYGHSLGGLAAFEITRELRRRGNAAPTQLLISGCRAPQIQQIPSIHFGPDDKFLIAIEQMYGPLPALIRSDAEMLQFFLRVLRADIALLEDYRYRSEQPLAVPIHVFGGIEDLHVSRHHLESWRVHSAAAFSLRMYPGDHFFIRGQAQERFLSDLNRMLEPGPWARGA